MMLLSLYTACSLAPLLCLVALVARLIARGRTDAILCTECQSCIAHCPGTARGANAFDIMRWAKTGEAGDALLRRCDDACLRCGQCRKDCPRGLAPDAMLPPRP